MSHRRLNLEVFAGSDHIVRRLRAAKRPEILMPMELRPEELDIEPEMLEPGFADAPDDTPIDDLPALPLDDREPVMMRPVLLSAHEILPDDGDEDD